MISVYYELWPYLTGLFNGQRYLVCHSVNYFNQFYNTSGTVHDFLYARSERIWGDNDGSVVFLKHRDDNIIDLEVDVKEFMWVKLKSIPYKP